MAKEKESPWYRRIPGWIWVALIIAIIIGGLTANQSLRQPTAIQPAEEPAEEAELAQTLGGLAEAVGNLSGKVEDLPSAEDIAKAVAEAMESVPLEPETSQVETCQRLPDYDRPPQPQIGHPSVYVETGVTEKTMCWTIPIKDDFVAIIGGFEVDGVSNGVYRAMPGPDTVTVSVTNGFALAVVEEVAREEFCFRVGQAEEYDWAHETVEPLPSWSACEISVAKAEVEPTEVPTTEVGLPPQPQVRHPTQYLETGRTEDGQAKTITWTFDVLNGTTLIVGGYTVDDRSGGVYKAWTGDQKVTVTVTDGFALIIIDEWAEAEFCFRVGEAKKYGWAHEYVEPLAEWDGCQ